MNTAKLITSVIAQARADTIEECVDCIKAIHDSATDPRAQECYAHAIHQIRALNTKETT